ncbi:hypothetical protein DSCA_18350 [Desulfosarcina alkanivorans]|uniref:Lcl C-terminal domain-containing protein n=2 Tax=Desulfosarcina alkanivorans TaxID=571177 RepID=A0A5K7YHM7_9BACT|nr:hypothetical protein DSCA_18350 [Desulfosarcina alkanivorans]
MRGIPKTVILILLIVLLFAGCGSGSSDSDSSGDDATSSEEATGYAIVDTGQTACYDANGNEITCPAPGDAFYGQDAQSAGNQARYTDNGDGTVTDEVTGLTWQQTPANTGLSYAEAQAYCESLTLGGHDDWRIPSTKELFSISNFSLGWPYLDTDYFEVSELAPGTTDYSPDYGYFWSSTSAYFGTESPEYYYAWYVAFGTAVDNDGADTHGAGAVRFDTKVEGGALGEGGERNYNYVRLVRDAD